MAAKMDLEKVSSFCLSGVFPKNSKVQVVVGSKNKGILALLPLLRLTLDKNTRSANERLKKMKTPPRRTHFSCRESFEERDLGVA